MSANTPKLGHIKPSKVIWIITRLGDAPCKMRERLATEAALERALGEGAPAATAKRAVGALRGFCSPMASYEPMYPTTRVACGGARYLAPLSDKAFRRRCGLR